MSLSGLSKKQANFPFDSENVLLRCENEQTLLITGKKHVEHFRAKGQSNSNKCSDFSTIQVVGIVQKLKP